MFRVVFTVNGENREWLAESEVRAWQYRDILQNRFHVIVKVIPYGGRTT